MNKKIIFIILIIVAIIAVGVAAFFLGRKSSNNIGPKFETSSDEDVYNKIVSVVNEYCDENGAEVTLNSTLVEELTDLYNSNPNNFNKETVGSYLMEQGWIARGVMYDDTNIDSSYNQNSYNSSSSSSQWSDTKIRSLLQEDWDRCNSRFNEVSISKIEKVEEDGNGRFIYAIYWSYVDLTTETQGWSPYQLYETDITGKVKEVTIYGVDTTNIVENKPNLVSEFGDEKNAYDILNRMKQNKELNWNQ